MRNAWANGCEALIARSMSNSLEVSNLPYQSHAGFCPNGKSATWFLVSKLSSMVSMLESMFIYHFFPHLYTTLRRERFKCTF